MSNQKIFSEIDNRLYKNKENLLSFAEKKGFKTYAECLHELTKNKTAKEVRKEIIDFGIPAPNLSTMWATKARIANKLENAVEKGVDKKNSRICATEECSGKVPPENHRYCKKCFARNKKQSLLVEWTI